MSPLTAARLIQFDEKCGNGAISKGEKCTKGQSGPAQKKPTAAQRVGGAAAGASVGFGLGRALSSQMNKTTPSNWRNTVKSGPGLLGGAGSTTGGMNGKRTPSAQQMKNMKSAKIPRIGRKGAALIAGGALAAGAITALAMRKKKKEKGGNSNFDPIAAAKAKEKQVNK